MSGDGFFGFAMQSRLRRRKKVGSARCGQVIEGPRPTLGQISPSRGRTGAPAVTPEGDDCDDRLMFAKLAEWHVTPTDERITARVLIIARMTTIALRLQCFVPGASSCRLGVKTTSASGSDALEQRPLPIRLSKFRRDRR